jgi:crotonobetainyl-CoA:carnitine CoA-transferase CaiB-like acyl-CoA transferase
LDSLIREWTINYDQYEVMEILQKAGVMAGASLNIEGVVNDTHLKERGFLVDVEYPNMTKLRRPSLPWRLSDTSRGNYQYAPALGEHNDYVFGELLGMSKDDIKSLAQAKVIY